MRLQSFLLVALTVFVGVKILYCNKPTKCPECPECSTPKSTPTSTLTWSISDGETYMILGERKGKQFVIQQITSAPTPKINAKIPVDTESIVIVNDKNLKLETLSIDNKSIKSNVVTTPPLPLPEAGQQHYVKTIRQGTLYKQGIYRYSV